MCFFSKQKMTMRHTPLLSVHQQANAQLAPFAGWQMPLHYGSQLQEHMAVRKQAGIFDVSHMRVCDVKGKEAKSFCRHVFANDVAKCEVGRALYSCMLNEKGGVIDDLIVYVYGDQHYRLVLNAGHESADKAWLADQQRHFDCQLTWPDDLAILAMQGPRACELVLGCLPAALADALPDMRPFRFAVADQWQVATTGYTGESGVEVILPAAKAQACWRRCVAAGMVPCGLAARDSLRLEAGFCLSGKDMDGHTTPWVSALAWTVSMASERDFIGRDALQAQQAAGPAEQLLGVVLQGRGVLREGQRLSHQDVDVGVVTSGGYSPVLAAGIGLARLSSTVQKGDVLQVAMRAKVMPVQVVKPPFVKHGQRNF
jgi:aminomethyltransferase